MEVFTYSDYLYSPIWCVSCCSCVVFKLCVEDRVFLCVGEVGGCGVGGSCSLSRVNVA